MTIAVNRNLSNCENSLVFHSLHGLMNSINWPASSIWLFIAQLGEHCSPNAEATASNPVEAPKNFFSGCFRNRLNCDSLRWSHTHFKMTPVGKNTRENKTNVLGPLLHCMANSNGGKTAIQALR